MTGLHSSMADLTEDEYFVAALVQASQHALQQLHLATLGPDLLRGGVGDAAVIGPLDEVGVVAVLAHLHEDIVQLGHADVGAPLGLGHGCHCLLHNNSTLDVGCLSLSNASTDGLSSSLGLGHSSHCLLHSKSDVGWLCY